MIRPLPRHLALLTSTLLLALSAQAQTGTTTTTATTPAGSASRPADPGTPKLLRSDSAFLKQAAEDGHAEIEASKVALQKASDPAVKAFAQKMIDEHGKTHGELTTLASSKGVELPGSPSLAQRAKMKLLQAADGASFDRRYAENIGVEAHESTLKMFRKAAADAKDPEIRAWAAKTVPALEQHLAEAKTLKSATDAKAKASK